MNMHSMLPLSHTSGKPMYLQIIDQVRHKVAIGDWPPGTDMPSIRQLAADLSISVITVKRAYQDLEQEGVILTQPGRGSIVAQTTITPATQWETELQQTLVQAVQIGKRLGLGNDELIDRLRQAATQPEEK